MARLARAPARLSAAPRRLVAAPKAALPFYKSPEWTALRASIIEERGKRCEECGRAGYVIADHVIEIKDGGAKLDRNNIRLLCPRDHGAKTQRAKRARLGIK